MEWGGGVDSEFIEENISFLCLFALLGGGGEGGVMVYQLYQYQRISIV